MGKSWDVIVVGAGAAGAQFACRLAEAHRRVLLLESGPARDLSDLISSQIWARRLKWGGAPMLAEGEDSHGLSFITGSGTGGAALHHYASWGRLHPEDFRLHTEHGVGHDWPIDYNTLRPYYDRVQSQIGLAGDAAAEIGRPPGAPYPMPGTARFAQGNLLARGFAALGRRVAPSPTPITSVDYAGRPACLYDGWCDAGCPIGALPNPLAIHLPRALQAGATLVNHASVLRVRSDGKRATGVVYADAKGAQHEASAGLVVLAANSVQNARLLLASAEGGLANRSGLLGRYVAMHSISAVFGLFAEPTENHLGHTAGQILCQDSYGKIRRAPEAFGSTQWIGGAAIKPNDLLGIANTRPDLFGPELTGFMRKSARHLAQMGSVNESIPQADNAITLSSQRDAFGVPLPRVRHTLHPRSHALWQEVRDDGLAILRAAGAQESWAGPCVTTHLMGGTIMGDDPASSVTNSLGEAHDLRDLVVAGPGLFPSHGAVGPTFTLYALGERTLDQLIG
jgi:choline dehydrogenase-like flavoprotein